MSAMMGADVGTQEDMFAKLESMRGVITEVNAQFKDAVRCVWSIMSAPSSDGKGIGKDDVCMRVHIRVSLVVRDGEAGAGADDVWD